MQPLRITEVVNRERAAPRWRNPNGFIPGYRNDLSNLHNNPVRRLSASNYARYESLSKTLKGIGRGSEKLRLTGTMVAGIKKFEEDERIYEELREQQETSRVLTLQAALLTSYNHNEEVRKVRKKKEYEMRDKEKELMQSEEALSQMVNDNNKEEKNNNDDYDDDFEPEEAKSKPKNPLAAAFLSELGSKQKEIKESIDAKDKDRDRDKDQDDTNTDDVKEEAPKKSDRLTALEDFKIKVKAFMARGLCKGQFHMKSNIWHDAIARGKFAAAYKVKSKDIEDSIDTFRTHPEGTGEEYYVLKMAQFGSNDCFIGKQSAQKIVMSSASTITNEDRKYPPVNTCAEFLREIEVLTQLQHENMVSMQYVLMPPAPFGIILEYMNGGSLGAAFSDNAWNYENISDTNRVVLMKDILQGLSYMHTKHYIHRDIKPHNILLCSGTPTDNNNNNDNKGKKKGKGEAKHEPSEHRNWKRAKIADFGTALKIPIGQKYISGEIGTSGYMAPEVMLGPYSYSADTFSVSIIIWQLFSKMGCKSNPLAGKEEAVLHEKLRPAMEPEHSTSVRVLCTRGWKEDASARPSPTAMLSMLKEMEV